MKATCARCGTYYDTRYGCDRCRAYQRNAEIIQNAQLAEIEQRRWQQRAERQAREAAEEERARQEMVSGLIGQGHSPEEATQRISQAKELLSRLDKEYRRFRSDKKECEEERRELSLANHVTRTSFFSVLTYPLHNAIMRGVVGLKPPPVPRPVTCPRCNKAMVIPSYDDEVVSKVIGDLVKEHCVACIFSPPTQAPPPPKRPAVAKVADTPRPAYPQKEIIFFGPKHAKKAPEPTKEQKLAVVDPSNPKSPFHGYKGDVKAIKPLLDSIVEALGRPNHEWLGAFVLEHADRATAHELAHSYAQAVELPFVVIDRDTFDAENILAGLQSGLENTLVPLVECGAHAFIAPPCVVFSEIYGRDTWGISTLKQVMKTQGGTTLDTSGITWIFSTPECGLYGTVFISYRLQVVHIDLLSGTLPEVPTFRPDLPEKDQWYVWVPGMQQPQGPMTEVELLLRAEAGELGDDALCCLADVEEPCFRYVSIVRNEVRNEPWFKEMVEKQRAARESKRAAKTPKKPASKKRVGKARPKKKKKGG